MKPSTLVAIYTTASARPGGVTPEVGSTEDAAGTGLAMANAAVGAGGLVSAVKTAGVEHRRRRQVSESPGREGVDQTLAAAATKAADERIVHGR